MMQNTRMPVSGEDRQGNDNRPNLGARERSTAEMGSVTPGEAVNSSMSPSQMLFKNNGQAGHTITVTGKIENTPVSFIVDTGATDTIVSERVFDSIPSEVRPDLYPVKDTGEQADGSPLAIIGWTTLKISIGPVAVSMPVTVAKIKNDVLLGMDFLSSTNCVIDATNRQLKFGEQSCSKI